MKVTYFKVKNASEEIKEQLLNKLVEFVDLEKFEDNQVVEDFGYDGNNSVGIMFTFLPEDQTNMFTNLLREFDLLITVNDVTSSVLMGDFDTDKKWIELFSIDDNAFFNHATEMLKEFLVNNLTKDMILDKMNEPDFKGLTDIDRQVLNA